MAAPNLGEIVTTTLFNQSKEFADNVEDNNALLKTLKDKGRIIKKKGGYEIREPLYWDENGTFGWYSGYEELDISPQDVLDAAVFDWKQASVAVSMSGLEERQNSGDMTQLFDLLDHRVTVAKKSMSNGLDLGIHSDGTGSSGKQINGLQAYVTSTPSSGTIGGIDASTFDFWRNVYRSTSTELATARSAANILSEIDKVYNQLVRGTDKPDLGLFDNTDFGYLLEALRSRQIFTNPKLAEAGFETIRYRSMDCVLDGGIGGNCPANSIYMLNTDYLKLVVHQDCYMTPLKPDRFATNQDAMVRLIGFMGNLVMSGRKFHGLLGA